MPFRDRQTAAIGEVLAPLLHGSKPSNLLLYGKTGTGKTAVARHVLKRLEPRARTEGISVHLAYSNTRVAKTEYRVLSDFAESAQVTIPFTGLALSEVSARLLDRIASTGLRAVFVLDEVDYLVNHFGSDLLYELTRVNERLFQGFVTLIGISNDLKFKELLDPRVLSSLGEEEIVFPPYSAEELLTILEDRASQAFHAGAITHGAIALCAALAGTEHGDARRAVDLLRVSGEVAERVGAKQVEEEHVRTAVHRIEQDRMVEGLRSLPLQVKLALLAVLHTGAANSTGEVYDQYTTLCRRSGVQALTQRRLSGFLSELDLLGLVKTNVVSSGRYGRTKRITPLIQYQLARTVFGEDPLVHGLL